MRVECSVEEVLLDGDNDRPVPGVCVRCSRCEAEETSFGTSERSIRRCLVILREECPNEEMNFYVTPED